MSKSIKKVEKRPVARTGFHSFVHHVFTIFAAAAAAVIGASSISPECSLKLSDDPESVAILNAKRLLL